MFEKMKYLVRQSFILLLLTFSFGACQPAPKEGIQLLKTQEEMQKEVSRFIPLGISIQQARQIMRDSKFSCEDIKNGFFVEKRDDNGHLIGEQTIVRGDFLSCGITHSYFIASTSWQVSLLHKNNRVIMVYAVIYHQNL
ncbi:hypothetical protein [Pseudanabaena sp. UWO310]|uniref:hypothetical protein n=1 Tax=Pseudanabaena sp. UWO310 TaxID=2480795 RepID=UPI00115ACD36|nr:hypothetical protein [Pseudanabaena sp. UWO310]TYQ30596.1 hypothetical protein PseudUWO310_08150 [Pseudanabaena sp. UWO310]